MTVNVTISQAEQGKLVEHTTMSFEDEQEANDASEMWWRMNIVTDEMWQDGFSQNEREEFTGLVWEQS
jgi:hypothetical protein